MDGSARIGSGRSPVNATAASAHGYRPVERALLFLERLVDDRRRGTLPPARRASDSPMAIACFRLVTFFFERPLRRVPRFRSRIARSTFFWASFP
jgi:hypothetical protein